MRTETIGLGLYALATALVAVLGYQLYNARRVQMPGFPADRDGLTRDYETSRKRAKERNPAEREWSYTQRQLPWWQQVENANWVGKEPPPPEKDDGGPKADPKPETANTTPLTDIMTLALVLVGAESRIVVMYKDPNVRPPKKESAAPGMTVPDQPVGLDGAGPVFQSLVPGESLYPPHKDIRLERVLTEGPSAVFSRASPKGNRVEEKMFLEEQPIGGDSFADVGALGVRAKSGSRGNRSGWVDPGKETKQVGNVWMVSTSDNEMLGNDYQKLLEQGGWRDEVIPIRDRRGGGTRRIKGVGIRTVPKALQRFGIQRGDILIKVNGTPVVSRASAIREGKRQYNRGVRTFELTFLSGRSGQEVVRVYRAPDK